VNAFAAVCRGNMPEKAVFKGSSELRKQVQEKTTTTGGEKGERERLNLGKKKIGGANSGEQIKERPYTKSPKKCPCRKKKKATKTG